MMTSDNIRDKMKYSIGTKLRHYHAGGQIEIIGFSHNGEMYFYMIRLSSGQELVFTEHYVDLMIANDKWHIKTLKPKITLDEGLFTL